LRKDVRIDLGCGATGVCSATLFIALIIMLVSIVSISFKMGGFSKQVSGVILLIEASAFTYMNWIPLELTILMAIMLFVFIIYDRSG